MRLCEACQQAADRWLDYKPPVRPTMVEHATYDGTAAGIADREQARFADWKRTVKHARSVIAEACANGKHVGEQ